MRTILILLLTGWAAAVAQVVPPSSDERQSQQPVVASQPASSMATPGFAERNPRYHLHSGDVLVLSFAFQPEFNQSVAVQPDGFVTLRQLGDLHVSGLTLPELQTILTARYGAILNAPEIEVQLKEFEKPYFIANGQVGHPGKYELRGKTTVTEGIAMAGGFNSASKHSQVLLFRKANEQWFETKVLDLKKAMKEKNLAEDPLLQPGDMIFVPQNRISKIQRYIPTPGVGVGVTY